MKTPLINRRHFLQGLSCSLVASGSTMLSSAQMPAFAGEAVLSKSFYAASRQDKKGRNEAVIFSPHTGDVRSVRLPGRAHDLTKHPLRNEVVAVARRPGRFLVVFSPDKKRKPLWLSSAKGRHFQGHGVFSQDGKLFFSAESDYEGERGVIGVRDVEKGYLQIGEFSSYGIGVHEIALHPDGKSLVLANGGILTHPDMGRAKLNLRTMKPSLVYLNAQSGQLIEKRTLPQNLHKLSIRHFAMTPNGETVFGCQYQGLKHNRPGLVGFHRRGEEPVLVKAPAKIQRQMQNYIGSVSVDQSGKFAATSAPRGNLVAFWDIAKRRFLTSTPLEDSCGLSPTDEAGHFMMSNGQGVVEDYDVSKSSTTQSLYTASSLRWDNHMLHLSKNTL